MFVYKFKYKIMEGLETKPAGVETENGKNHERSVFGYFEGMEEAGLNRVKMNPSFRNIS